MNVFDPVKAGEAMARMLAEAGMTERQSQALLAAYAVAIPAITMGLTKAMGLTPGDRDWEHGLPDWDLLDDAVGSSPLFEDHAAALMEFAGVIHRAAFALAEDVAGRWTAGAVELGRGH